MIYTIKINAGYGFDGTVCQLHEIRTLGTAITSIGDALFAAGANAANLQMVVGPLRRHPNDPRRSAPSR